MDKWMPGRRLGFALITAGCAGAIGFALFAQHVLGIEPCPMCIFQRVAVMFTGLFALLGALHNPGRRGYGAWGALALLSALGGLVVAVRQVWLQQLPADQVPSCGPGLDYMLETMPLWNVFSKVLSGSGECARVDWTLLGLSMPAWSGLFFAGVSLFIVWLLARDKA